MVERIVLKYIGKCQGGPWNGQEIHGEMPAIASGPWRRARYLHENGVWRWDDPDGETKKSEIDNG